MTNDREILNQLIAEKKNLLENTQDDDKQKELTNQIEKLERRLTCIEQGKDPSNTNGRLLVLGLGAILAPFTGGTSLIAAGLHAGASIVQEEMMGTDIHTKMDMDNEAKEQADKDQQIAELEAQLAKLRTA